MANNVCALDFEFSHVSEPKLTLVCAATLDVKTGKKIKWWLKDKPEVQKKLLSYLKGYQILLAYSAVAEARSIQALGGNPLDWQWVDLHLEYRQATNHNDHLQYGEQLVDGKIKLTRKPRPKWERTEEDRLTGFAPTHSLAEATFKLTGAIRDTVHKTEMCDLIISAPSKYSHPYRDAILAYCLDDVVYLPKIWEALKQEYKRLVPGADMQKYFRAALLRGRYAAHTAIMETLGYPINLEATRNFAKSIPSILFDVQREINEHHSIVKPFRWNGRESKYSWDQKATRAWIAANHDVDRWMKTDKGALSLALEAFEKFYPFKHDYPLDNLGAQFVRFLKLKQSVYGFSEGGNKRSFFDSVGSDGRVRPYMNIYRAQSSRSQPAATGFMFLKPAWMRALVQPEPGYYMAGIDYASQEFFAAALESEDRNMIQAYLSGDPYLYLAKRAGAIPPDGTKKTHGAMRDMFKSTVLGISYLMTSVGLAVKLTGDTGEVWDEDRAQEQIDIFYEEFWKFKEWQDELKDSYAGGGAIELPCGWTMWSDNENIRSVCNVPIQGLGASVMRKAVDLAVGLGVRVVFTLHDAIYIEGKVGQEKDIVILRDCMREAFQFYFEGEFKELAGNIRLDPKAWGPDYVDGVLDVEGYKVPISTLHIDSRARSDYDKFSKYFLGNDADLL